MGSEDQKFTNGWTLKTIFAHFAKVITDLRNYLDQRFSDNDKAVQTALVAQEKAVTAALQASKEAVLKAEIATEKRFDSVNEFRAQLADQSATLMPRSEFQVQHAALNDKIDTLIKSTETKSEEYSKQLAALNLSIIGNSDIRKLQSQAAVNSGITRGSDKLINYLIMATLILSNIVLGILALIHK